MKIKLGEYSVVESDDIRSATWNAGSNSIYVTYTDGSDENFLGVPEIDARLFMETLAEPSKNIT